METKYTEIALRIFCNPRSRYCDLDCPLLWFDGKTCGGFLDPETEEWPNLKRGAKNRIIRCKQCRDAELEPTNDEKET